MSIWLCPPCGKSHWAFGIGKTTLIEAARDWGDDRTVLIVGECFPQDGVNAWRPVDAGSNGRIRDRKNILLDLHEAIHAAIKDVDTYKRRND